MRGENLPSKAEVERRVRLATGLEWQVDKVYFSTAVNTVIATLFLVIKHEELGKLTFYAQTDDMHGLSKPYSVHVDRFCVDKVLNHLNGGQDE